jgi:hypothetical protein
VRREGTKRVDSYVTLVTELDLTLGTEISRILDIAPGADLVFWLVELVAVSPDQG